MNAMQAMNDSDAAGICAAASLFLVDALELNPPEMTASRTNFALREKFVTEKMVAAMTRPIAVCAQCLTLAAQSEENNK